MSKQDKVPEAENDNPHGSSEISAGEDIAPFERWLDRKLKTVYGSVLQEPIPQDILDLLKQRLDGN